MTTVAPINKSRALLLTLLGAHLVNDFYGTAMSLAQSFWFIVGVSLLAGLAAATYHPQATSFIVNAYPQTRGKMLGSHGWGGSGGHFLAPAVVVLTVAAFGWRIAMATIAVPMLVTAVVLHSRLKEAEPNPQATIRGAISRNLLLLAAAFGVVSMVGRSFLTFFVKMLVLWLKPLEMFASPCSGYCRCQWLG